MKKISKIIITLAPDLLAIAGFYLIVFGVFSEPNDPFSINLVNYHTTEKVLGSMILFVGILLMVRIKTYRRLFSLQDPKEVPSLVNKPNQLSL